MSRAIGACVTLMLATAACGSVPAVGPASATSAASTNVSGTIDRAAATPTCPAGEPCDPHIVAYRLVFSAQGRPDVAVRVRPDGTFALHLDPGVYSIAAEPPSFQGHLEPSEVRVPKDGSAVYLQLHFVAA